MRVDDDGKQLSPPSVTPSENKIEEEEEIERYDPEQDHLAKLFAMFTHINYASANPEISIAARLLSRLKLVPVKNPNICPMMAVGIKNHKHILMYNPTWVENVSFSEVVATLVHEAYHVMLRDIPRFLRRMAMFPDHQQGSAHQVLNVALDAANNDLIQDRMPHMKYGKTGYWVLPENTSLTKNQPSEHYFEILLERARKASKKVGKSLQDFIDAVNNNPNASEKEKQLADAAQNLLDKNAHDWAGGSKTSEDDQPEDMSDMSPDELEALASQLDEEAKKHAVQAMKNHQKRHGKLPGHHQEILDELLSESEIPWTTFLRQLVAARISAHKHKTPTKFHNNQYIYAEEDEDGNIVPKDFPLPIFPGVEVDRTFVIMFAIDTSGSMSAEDVEEGLAELQGLIRTDPNVHVLVVQADTRISDVSVLNPEESLESYMEKVGIKGRGGTDFNKPFQLAQYVVGKREHPPVNVKSREKVAMTLHDYDNIDLMVYHTDGYAPAPNFSVEPDCPTIWCLPENNRTIPGMGQEIFGTVISR